MTSKNYIQIVLVSLGIVYAGVIKSDDLKITSRFATIASSEHQIKAVGDYVLDFASAELTKGLTGTLQHYFPTIEMKTSVNAEYKPNYSGLVLKPFWENTANDTLLFFQSSLYHHDERTTTNFGLGSRKLFNSNTLLVGANAFYDYESPYDLERYSLGGEVKLTVGEIKANYYQSKMDRYNIEQHIASRGLGGYDFEAAMPLPYLPTTKVFAKRYKWESLAGNEIKSGETFSLHSEVYRGVTFVVGRRKFDAADGENYALLKFTKLFSSPKNDLTFFAKSAYTLSSIKDARYSKVSRNAFYP